MSAASKPKETDPEPREAIFISHAAPEDNAFTIWLGAKLSALGCEVWTSFQNLLLIALFNLPLQVDAARVSHAIQIIQT